MNWLLASSLRDIYAHGLRFWPRQKHQNITGPCRSNFDIHLRRVTYLPADMSSYKPVLSNYFSKKQLHHVRLHSALEWDFTHRSFFAQSCILETTLPTITRVSATEQRLVNCVSVTVANPQHSNLRYELVEESKIEAVTRSWFVWTPTNLFAE